MDSQRFDDLARSLSQSRRGLLGLGAALGLAPLISDGRKRKKKKKCKGCTECQACKKGKCRAKPEGSACVGGLCTGGGCACFAGFRSCQGRCIPDDQCCTAAECGQSGSCQNGTCICTGETRRCGNRCIPVASCCTTADCTGGKTCLSSGACALTCPSGQCPGTCDCTATVDNEADVCFSYGNPPTFVCDRPACDVHTDCGAGEQCLLFDCNNTGVYVGRCLPLC